MFDNVHISHRENEQRRMSKGEGEAQKDRKKYSQRFIIETHTLVQSAILSDSI